MFPVLLIVIGITVLALGKRLSIMGAAVGFLLGVGLLRLFPETSGPIITFGIPIGLAVAGFFAAAFARGIIDIVILVVGAIAGAAVVLGFLDLFNIDLGLANWLLAVVGGVAGFMMIRRGRKGSKDWGMVILASLVGALLVTRGIVLLMPSLQDTITGIIAIALTAGGIVYQGGFLTKDDSSEAA